MSISILPKNLTKQWAWIWEEYQREHSGPFEMRGCVIWAVQRQLVDVPRVDPMAILVKKAKEAARSAKIRNPQGHLVRQMLAAKVPHETDEKGNRLLFKVRYDHIHQMDLEHALLVFDQLGI